MRGEIRFSANHVSFYLGRRFHYFIDENNKVRIYHGGDEDVFPTVGGLIALYFAPIAEVLLRYINSESDLLRNNKELMDLVQKTLNCKGVKMEKRGEIPESEICPMCGGTGYHNKKICPMCDGLGRKIPVNKDKTDRD